MRDHVAMLLRIGWAAVVFAVFGALTVAMGRSAVRDLREGHDDHDGVVLFSGIQALVPTLLAGAVALVGPVLILVRE